jgi:hypothetical protein
MGLSKCMDAKILNNSSTPKVLNSSKILSSVYLAFPFVCEALWHVMVIAPKTDHNNALGLLLDLCLYSLL